MMSFSINITFSALKQFSKTVRALTLILSTSLLWQSASARVLIFEDIATLALIENCGEDCPARTIDYLKSKGYRCHDHSDSVTRCENNARKETAYIDKKNFKNLLGNTVYLRVVFQLSASETQSIEQLKAEYFPTWNYTNSTPPEHTYANSDSLSTWRGNKLRTIVFGQTKNSVQSIANVTLAITSFN